MRIKKVLIAITYFIIGTVSFAQSLTLSTSGSRHWRTANTLLEMASSLEQKEMAISEFELVKESDPKYPDTYYKLGSIYFELAKEFGKEKYFELAKRNYYELKSIYPQDSDKIDDEIYLIESVHKLSQKNITQNSKSSFVGVWVNKDFPRGSYIFRIKAYGDSYDVKVSTADERVLETMDVIYDGETLSFTVKDVDRMGTPTRVSWGGEHGKEEVVCDLEEEFDYWKLMCNGEQLSAHCDHRGLYYLNGDVKKRRNYTRSWVLVQR